MALQTSEDQERIFRCSGSYNMMKDYKDKCLFFGIMCMIRSGMCIKEVNMVCFDFMLTLALLFVVFASFRRRYKKLCQNKSFNSLSSSSNQHKRVQRRSWALTWEPHRGRIRRSSSLSGSRHRSWRICGETETAVNHRVKRPAQFLGQKYRSASFWVESFESSTFIFLLLPLFCLWGWSLRQES